MSKSTKRPSLVGQVKSRLLFNAVIFVGLFLVFLTCTSIVTITVYLLEEQKVALHDDMNNMLTAMIDQETGLGGYIATNDPSFLAPFTSGRPEYLASFQAFRRQTDASGFGDSAAALAHVEKRAETWYTTYALVQIKYMQSGQLAAARSVSTTATGKTLFDQVRAAITRLQQTTDRDILSQERHNGTIDDLAILLGLSVSVGAVFLLRRLFTTFAGALRAQLGALEEVTHRLGAGDLTARVQELTHQELRQLGQTLNHMATMLQQQQMALQEKDILENVLHLNSTLAQSLDLHAVASGFLQRMLALLEVQLGALYLYDPGSSTLTLYAAQGMPADELQRTFRLDEGSVGQAASRREPLFLGQPGREQVECFQVKTVLGQVLPASLYQLPLLVGNTLLGVLVAGSLYPMQERARNVLLAVSSGLAAMLSNAHAYLRMQNQAEELAQRNQEQAEMNNKLLRQRDELERVNTELEAANQARSLFISTMSHELRTPLTSILGFCQVILRDPASANWSQRLKDNLERILKNGRHLLALVNDVLDIGKIESGRLEVSFSQVELGPFLSSLVEEVQPLALEQSIVVRAQVEPGAESLETDAVKLHQILLNLVSNAVKFTEHGEVTITATSTTDVTSPGEHIAIAVKDNGIGIAPEQHAHIFQAFYQVERSSSRRFGGTGLGLAIVSQLTRLLGGTIAVESMLGEGSTFTVTLPRLAEKRDMVEAQREQPMRLAALPRLLDHSDGSTSDAPDASTDGPEQSCASECSRRTILAVDDHADILALLSSLLENTPYEVRGVQDPAEVQDLARELQPCAITLDVMMPRRNGWQVLYQLKTTPETAHIPVIMLTILAEQNTGYTLGADAYLIKPFEREALLETLHRVVEQPTLVQT